MALLLTSIGATPADGAALAAANPDGIKAHARQTIPREEAAAQSKGSMQAGLMLARSPTGTIIVPGAGRYPTQHCWRLKDATSRLQSAKSELEACLRRGDDCDMQVREYKDAKDDYDRAESEAMGECGRY